MNTPTPLSPLSTRIIPCLDVRDGRVVKGIQFENLQDIGDPVEQAVIYNRSSADELCFLDITASAEERGPILDVIARTAQRCFIPVTVGGGIKQISDIDALLKVGADKVSINTAAVYNRDFINQAAQKFGAQCIVAAVDARRVAPQQWEIFTHGGRTATGIDVLDYVRDVVERGAGEILLTSMDCDGMKQGFDLDLTAAVSNAINVPVIASGGAGCIQDFIDVTRIGCADAILAASLFHFGELSIPDLKTTMQTNGLNVRL